MTAADGWVPISENLQFDPVPTDTTMWIARGI
jgi:hypothetical protein